MTIGDRMLAFIVNNANERIYASLRDDEVQLALQIHHQYFHINKPQKYTQLDTHIAYLFSLAMLRKQHVKADWGLKILNDIKKVVQLRSYKRIRYIGNGVILMQIAYYEALRMRNKI